MSKFTKKLVEYFDSIWYSSLQSKIAVASFIIGSVIVMVCLFCILPIGEIATSALQAAGMFLILSGAGAGIKVAFDLQSQKFSSQLNDMMEKMNEKDKERSKRKPYNYNERFDDDEE